MVAIKKYMNNFSSRINQSHSTQKAMPVDTQEWELQAFLPLCTLKQEQYENWVNTGSDQNQH